MDRPASAFVDQPGSGGAAFEAEPEPEAARRASEERARQLETWNQDTRRRTARHARRNLWI